MISKSIAGRVAIVTGASRGIGREIALKLGQAGCHVVVAAKSVTEKENLPGTIYSVAAEIRECFPNTRSLAVQVDVRDDASVANMVQATIDEFGRIDFLIVNSGALWWKDVIDTPMKRYDLINQVNSRGAFTCVHAVLPHMKRTGFGRIVVMSPPVDLTLLTGKVAYFISKYGMTMLAMGLAEEVRGDDIGINALWPVTLVESFATKNFQMGERSAWRKASIIADCVDLLVRESTLSGQALLDEDYLRSRGTTDFTRYRYDPEVEPPKAWPMRGAKTALTASRAKETASDKQLPPGIDPRQHARL